MPKMSRGFSLIELMVALVIVGVLAGIAFPSYTAYVLKGNRTEAKTRLLQIAQLQERNYSEKNVYICGSSLHSLLGLPSGTVYSASNNASTSGYQVTCTPNTATAATFTLSASPQGNQTNDTKCGTLTLAHTGAKGMTGGTGTAAECWAK